MNPMATMFCAAAVLIPTFQMDTACAAVITSRAASLESFGRPKATTMPMRMGTTAPARAVAEGTKKARRVEMMMAPATR